MNNLKAYLLACIQLLNIIITIVALVKGIKCLKLLKENKILFVIPALSLLQIVLSEVVRFSHLNRYIIVNNTIVLANIYTTLEYYLIIIFFWKLRKTKVDNVLILIAIISGTIALFFSQYLMQHKDLKNIDIFLFIEGPIIISIALFLIIRAIKYSEQSEYIDDPNTIATFGIFLSFLIIWPTNFLQGYFLKSPFYFYNFLFISNSIGYLILFQFFSYSANVTRKRRNN